VGWTVTCHQCRATAAVDQEAEVIILFSPISSDRERLALMKEAMSDPLFVADIEEIGEDFRYDVLPAKAC